MQVSRRKAFWQREQQIQSPWVGSVLGIFQEPKKVDWLHVVGEEEVLELENEIGKLAGYQIMTESLEYDKKKNVDFTQWDEKLYQLASAA